MSHKEKSEHFDSFYINPIPPRIPINQLLQLVRIVHDRDLISKRERDELVTLGYVTRAEGFNIITRKGITCLQQQGRLFKY